MNYLVATPEGNKRVAVDPANIEAFTGGGLTAEQIAERLAKLPVHAVPAYYAAAMSELPAGTLVALYRGMNYDTPNDKWPFWPAVLDPRPDEIPDGDTGRMLGLSDEQRLEYGPEPVPVEWWNANNTEVTGEPGDQLTDAEHAKRIREAAEHLKACIDEGVEAGLIVRAQALVMFGFLDHFEIARPL